jgi:isoleucyl-tRNA synthetase
MIENAPPWDNLKFDEDGVKETQRRFFGTLLNTYSFFALYANIDKYRFSEGSKGTPSILDNWILSKLQSLIEEVTKAYDEYEPTKAARAIQEFVNDHLSNWYVRLNRKRFWVGKMSDDKAAAYTTLYTCLLEITKLMSPIAPFFSDWIFKNLTEKDSVHLSEFPKADKSLVNEDLELSMNYAQQICSLVHSIRKNAKVKVRTPLNKVLLPVLDDQFARRVKTVDDIICAEVNVKSIEYIDDTSDLLVKKVKPNFAKLGKKYGPKMKEVTAVINAFSKQDISAIEKSGMLSRDGFDLALEDVLISSEDVPGWAVASENGVTVALDINITEELKKEGIARDFVNRIQNLRKELGLEVLDKISIEVEKDGEAVTSALTQFREYISTETQALSFELKDKLADASEIDMDDFSLRVKISRK